MSHEPSFDRRLGDWLEEGPVKAPVQILEVVMAAVPSVAQRRGATGAPWRFLSMNGYARAFAAIAAVVAIAVGAALFVPRSTPNEVAGSPPPSGSATAVVTFTSPQYGYTVDVPGTWVTTPATQPWPGDDGLEPNDPPFSDVFHLAGTAARGATVKALILAEGTSDVSWLAQWERMRTVGGHCFGSATPWTDATVAGHLARRFAWRCDTASSGDYDEYAFLVGRKGFVVSGTPSMVDVLVRSFRAP